MTSHMTVQPRHCLQCLRIGLLLTHGRCSTCRGRTPAAVWNEHHGGKVRAQQADTKGVLLRRDEAAAMRARFDAVINSAKIHRDEAMGERCLFERHTDLDKGVSVYKVTLMTDDREVVSD